MFPADPQHEYYDIVIIGGAIMGSSLAWFLNKHPNFQGRVLVIERDASYESSATAHTNSCIRQQFSTELNTQISQFTADFINNLPDHMEHDPLVPQLSIRNTGYMYLADKLAFADHLRRLQIKQRAWGAATEILTTDEIAARYPFYTLDNILLGSINLQNEGPWDGQAVFSHLARQARQRGVEYVENEVVDLDVTQAKVTGVVLRSGQKISCGTVVNAAGTRAPQVAQMAGVYLPIEPRKRYSWVFKAAQPLDRPLPLTIDPLGFHVHGDGSGSYLCGATPDPDPAVAPDDFSMDHDLWETQIWPALATRIPAFETIKVTSAWAGHYDMNVFDHNAILGPHPEVENFIFMNGFSGHGLQQAPAVGRGLAELICSGEYQTLDLSPFHYDRIAENKPITEAAVI